MNLFKEIEARGIATGETRGRATGIISMCYDFGLSENETLDKLQEKLEISLEEAKEFMKKYGEE